MPKRDFATGPSEMGTGGAGGSRVPSNRTSPVNGRSRRALGVRLGQPAESVGASLAKHETVWEAEQFQKYRNQALRSGLCFKCSCQDAYGRQHGYAQVHPPCEECLPVIATFPTGRANGWRTPDRGGWTGPRAAVGAL